MSALNIPSQLEMMAFEHHSHSTADPELLRRADDTSYLLPVL